MMTRRPLLNFYYLNASQIPALRAVGFGVLCVWVLLYQSLISRSFSMPAFAEFVAIMAAYCVVSWLVLLYSYNRKHLVDLGLLFLVMDLPCLLYAIHSTGANESLLFFVVVLRVADQAHVSVRRMLLFAHLTVAAYVVYLCYLVGVEGRSIMAPVEGLKLAYIYGTNLYLTFTAGPWSAYLSEVVLVSGQTANYTLTLTW